MEEKQFRMKERVGLEGKQCRMEGWRTDRIAEKEWKMEMLVCRMEGKYTSKTPYRTVEKDIPRNELRGLIPNSYIHISVSDLCIPRTAVFLSGCSKIGGPILGIYKSLTNVCMNMEIGNKAE
jgi:hypothetical protein